MTKSQVIQTLADQLEQPKKTITDFLDAVCTLAYAETKKNGEFVLPGIGKLIKKKRDARQGRNPATGETITIPAKTVVKFRLSKQAKDAIL